MVKQRRWMSSLVLAGSLIGAPVSGAAQDAGWSRVEAVPEGSRVRVTLFDGTRLAGTLDRAGATSIRLHPDPEADTTAARHVSRDEIRMVERLGRRTWTGTAIGMGAGALAGLITILAVEPKDSRVPVRANHALPVMLFTTAVGAGAGAITDLLRRPAVDVVYLAPAPAPAAPGEPGDR